MPHKTIEAVVEITSFDGEPPWAVASLADQTFLRLFAGVTDEEIGSIILTACLYNQVEIHSSAIETLNAFIAEDFVLSGGLRFSSDAQVKVVPGCCCGLEDWREWLDVPNGNNSVWAGHDPNPGVEFVDDSIRIWQDEKADGVEFVDLGVDEMRGLMERVESDLKGFVVRLGKWAEFVAPELKLNIVKHFTENMNIRQLTLRKASQ
jgi:hypothetical protein